MTLTIDLPDNLEQELVAEAARRGLPLSEYALHVLSTRDAQTAHEHPQTGAQLVALWESQGLIGARPEIADALLHARQIRETAEHRTRE